MFRAPLIAAAALLAALPVAAQEPKLENRVVVGIFGGLLGQQLRGFIDPYMKPLGVEVVYVEGTSNDHLAKVRAQRANPQTDLFVGNDQTFAVAKSLGLVAKIDPKLVPNIGKVRPEYRDKDGYGQFYEINPVGLVYRSDKFAEAKLDPSSWMVYADPGLKGRGILFPPTVSYGFHLLIGLANGHKKDERDISAAWPDLQKIVANGAVVVPTPGQAEQMAGRGEGWVYVSSAARAQLLRDQGAPMGFSIPKEGTIVFPNFMAPVANSKSPVAAQRILNHMLSKEVQGQLVQVGAVAPVSSEVELTPQLKARLGFDADKPLPTFDVLKVDAINDQLDQWVERFNRTVSR